MLNSARFRSFLVFLFDLSAVVVAWVGAFLLRFNFQWPYGYGDLVLMGLVPLLAAQALACRWAKLYRGMWIFASLPDLRRVLKAVSVSAAVLVVFAALAPVDVVVPRSIVLLYPLLLVMIMAGGRISWRMWKEGVLYRGRPRGKPVVVVGAGTAGAMLVRELDRSSEWHVVALIDDDAGKQGLELLGRRVEGPTDRLADSLLRHGAQHVIMAMPSASAGVVERVMRTAREAGAQLFTVPGLSELMSGRVAINMMRPLRIEDLLGREAVQIDNANLKAMLKGKRILVTGAGGSIGSELCRQLARFQPGNMLLLESGEFALYSIEEWFQQQAPEQPVTPLIADVKDEALMTALFERWRPQIVFHAAAYKHVPLMEINNAWQAVRNNVLGTLSVARLSKQHGVERFVLISTDKAVNPTNVMGATKRLAEMACQALQADESATVFQVVRFGNVLGSTGSVIPKFQAQIERGGPVTVTHPEINRYFMSIPEAAQLVLQAATMGQGGEVFVLDMGEPIKIVDLARNMIRLSGHTEEEIGIEFTGLRPGEKLYEELLADAETTLPTPHPKLRVARSRGVPAGLDEHLRQSWGSLAHLPDADVRQALSTFVPEYQAMAGQEEPRIPHES